MTLQRLAASADQNDVEEWMRAGASITVEDAYRLALAVASD